MIPVVIQAGGKGTRLRPYTMVLPKPLMPVGDMPVLEIVLRQLRSKGITDIYISVGHLGHLLQAYFGDGGKWGMDIRYLFEDEPLGTIGPIRNMPRPDGPFMVMNGDLVTDLDYAELIRIHQEEGVDLTIGGYECEVPVSLGVLDIDEGGTIQGFREKPTLRYWASMGVYVFSPSVWDLVPENTLYGFDTLMEEVLAGKIRARVHRFRGIWLDIGRPEDYERATQVIEENRETLIPAEE